MEEREKQYKTPASFKVLATVFLLLQLFLAGTFLYLCYEKNKNTAIRMDDVKEMTVPVAIYQVRPQKVIDSIEIPGIIESWDTIIISSEINGQIADMNVCKGDKVKEGQVVMKLDDTIYKAEKNKTESKYKLAQQNFERLKKLYEAKSVSVKELEDAENFVIETKSEFEIAKHKLQECEIRSPVEGYVEKKPVALGEYVQEGTQVCIIEQVDDVTLVFSIPEKDVIHVKLGELVKFSLDCYPSKEFEGKIAYRSLVAEKESLSFKVEADVSNKDLLLRPGMIARVRLERSEINDKPVIPMTAIIPKYEGHYVFVATENGKARLREVKVMLISGKNAVISEGLSFGEKIVIEGQRMLNENDSIRIVESKS